MDKDKLLREFVYTILSDPTHMSKEHIISRLFELAEKAEHLLDMKLSQRVADEAQFEDYML